MIALPPPWIYVATAEPFDDEMAARIAEHRARRDNRWRTVEAPRDLVSALAVAQAGASVLIDCLTLWLSNVLLADADIDVEIKRLEDALMRRRGVVVLVANEVGLSLIHI